MRKYKNMEEEKKVVDQPSRSFSEALELLKQGERVARRGWNGKDMFAFLVDGSEFEVNRAPLDKFFDVGTKVTYRPHIDLKAVDGSIGVYAPSSTDILSEDWYVVEKQLDENKE